MTIGDIIKKYREEHGITMAEFAEKSGISKGYLSMLERNENPRTKKPISPSLEKVKQAVDFMGMDLNEVIAITEDQLISLSPYSDDTQKVELPKAKNIVPFPEMEQVPLIGKIACGTPILAEENIQDIVSAPKQMRASFSLICQGDSMIDAGIFDGDIVYIRSQPEVENGEIAAVLIGDEATLKQVYITSDTLLLVPANHKYDTITLKEEEMNTARIIGKYVGLTRFAEK